MKLRDFAQATASWRSAEVLSGRYRLDGCLGSGGAADVHRGFDLRLRRPVAVKIFRPDACSGGGKSLDSEALILARLHHPGLVTAFDVGQHDGRDFLVMQLIEGITLKERISRGPLPPEATAAVGAGLAQALGHAHEAGIVHRDVKPSNILLDHADHPYLADFGISHRLDTTHTATNTIIGTPAYLSPEQVLGQPVGRPADIYALGLVLLECLTGTLEYEGVPLEAAIARLHRSPVLPPELPKQLSYLLRRMTALDEQARPPARDCARELLAVADTAGPRPLVPLPPTTSLVPTPPSSQTGSHTHFNSGLGNRQNTSVRLPARRRTVAVGTVVALTAVVATALGVTGTSAPQDNGRTAAKATGTPNDTSDTPSGNTGQRRAPAASPTTSSPDHSASGKKRPDSSADNSADRSTHPAPRNRKTPKLPKKGDTATQYFSQPPGQAKKTDTNKGKARNKNKSAAPKH
ncbi:protein kinase [Streptomyces sp. KA12]|uniref:serine/threonine-protein kinase n=1 Tax=Streptomyces sp. KA12 TaxID=2991730 RepID=UPI0023B09333|nr:serine/threonine-protein kinase [Streptomyces sp. KA12]MDF0376185.1 protein kinase [Streptomyces sp. KA12]